MGARFFLRKVHATLGVSCYLFLIEAIKMKGKTRHEVAPLDFTGDFLIFRLWHL